MRKQAFWSMLVGLLKYSVRQGCAIVTDWEGRVHTYGKDEEPPLHVKVADPAILPRLLLNASLGVGEGYMYGKLKIEERDLPLFFKLVAKNKRNFRLPYLFRAWNTKKRQKKYIAAHYDLGNEYYRLWLDKDTMLYSCARFKSEGDSLERAQRQKIDYLLQKLQLREGQTLLDIGCGWGHLAVAAAKKYRARVVGITLSEEQLRGAIELAEREGVAELVEFRLMNYQDLDSKKEQFDRIISVGMFEHVGKGKGGTYFKQVRRLLADGGISVLHTITSQSSRPVSAWLDKYVFPGGYLPTVLEIEAELKRHGFWLHHQEDMAQQYAHTCHHWRERHREHKETIIRMFQERYERGDFWLPGDVFYKMRDFWLTASEAGFAFGELGLSQFVFTKGKPKPGSYPLTHDFS